MTNPGCVACSIPCPQIIIIPRGEKKTQQHWSTDWILQSNSCLVVPEVQLHAFCGCFSKHLGWSRVRAHNHTFTGCSQTFHSLSGLDSNHSSTVTSVPVARQHLDVYFEVCPDVASETKASCALHFPQQAELKCSIFILSLCVPFNAVFHACTAYSAGIKSVIFCFPQIMFRLTHFAVLYFI